MTFWVAGAVVVAGVGSAYLQSQAAGNAASQYANAANQGINYSNQVYGNITQSTLPYQNTGLQANNAINSMLPGQYTNSTGGTSTGNGYLTAQPTMNDLTTLMPNYQFGMTQGMGQFNAGINAAGGAVSGNAICWYYRAGYGLLATYQGKPLVPDGDNRYHAILGNSGPAYFVNPSSLAPILIALGAKVRLQSPQGAREPRRNRAYHAP